MSEEKVDTPPLQLNFIRDAAAADDFFASPGEIGSHERIATAVATAIRQSPDLKVIGLLGPWGSGKSTVVGFVEKHLKAEDAPVRTYTFCFDAWLHQSDPPRRAFLETFIRFLIKEKLTNEDRWKKQLAELNRQIEETETTSTPALTFSGRVLLFLLLLVPFGLQFVGHDWFEAAYGDKPSIAALWAFWLGFATIPLTLFAALFIYYRWRPVRLPWKDGYWTRKNWSTNRPPHEDDSLLSLFINRQLEKQKSRVVRTPDPTAIEFQRIFRDIITAVSQSDRRIILVIDNLDRLNETDAVTLWGTIRSFFLGAVDDVGDIPDAQLPTVILPVDQKALERMYETQHDADVARILVRSFMDKTFDLTFYVTPPVLSDWHAYLSAKMRSVFGDHLEADWAFHVGRLYEKRYQEDGGITPRDINVTINAIATLWLQWHGQGVSFVTVAYYVIFRDKVDEGIVGAVHNPKIDVSEFDPDWQRGLAALHFGRAPDVAIQILIEPQLRRAIENHRFPAFKEQAETRGFQEVFQRILDASAGELAFASKASLLLNELAPADAPWVDSAWRTLRRLWTTSKQWGMISKNEPAAIKALLAHCGDAMLATFIGRVTRRLGEVQEPVLATGQNTQHFAAISRELVAAAKENSLEPPAITVNGGPTIFLTLLAYASGNRDLNKSLITELEPHELVKTLATLMQDATASNGAHLKLSALLTREEDVDWTPVLDAARDIVANRNIPFPGMMAAVDALGHFFSRGDAHSARVRDLVRTGVVNNRMAEARAAKNYELMAKLTALAFVGGGTPAQPNGEAWAAVITAHPKLPELVDQYIRAYAPAASMHFAVNASTDPSCMELCRAITSHRVRQNRWGSMFVDTAIAEIDKYLNAMEPDLHTRFLNGFSGYESFWDEIDGDALNVNVQRILTTLSVESPAIAKEVRQRARKILKSKLDAVTTTTWQASVRDGSEPLAVAQVLAGTQKAQLGLSSNLFDALTNLRQELVANHPRPFGSRWFQAAKLLSLSAKRTLFANLRDHINGAPDIPRLDELLLQGGAEFLADGKFAEASDSSVRHIILPLLDSTEGLAWLVSNADTLANWITASSEDTQTFLKDQLHHRGSGVDAGGREQLGALATAWTLAKPVAKEGEG